MEYQSSATLCRTKYSCLKTRVSVEMYHVQFINSETVKANVPEGIFILLQISAQSILTLLSRPFSQQRKSTTHVILDFELSTSAPVTQN